MELRCRTFDDAADHTVQQVQERAVPGVARNAIAAALGVITLSSASAGEGTSEQRVACRNDAWSFCREEIPDVERITACMIKNLKKLSPPCRAQFKASGQGI